jgi:F0F1-type ATP synthase epsilon subunit
MADQIPTPDAQPRPADSIRVTVRDRKRIVFDKDAKAVTARNDTGTFDVLAQHANFISLVNQSITVHTIDGEKVTIPISNGVLKVKDNGVHCYINLLSTAAQQQAGLK